MMRGYCRAVAVVLIAAAVPVRHAAAQTGFNGVITFRSEGSSGKQDTMVQYSKGRKVRIDGFGSERGAMIVDNDAKLMMIVDPAKQQYMTMTEDDAKQMQAMMGPMMEQMKQRQSAKADASKLSFGKTGKTEIVAGVPCEVWRGKYTGEDGDEDEGEACIATGVGFALDALTFNNPMLQQRGAAHDQLEQYRQLVGGNKGILKATSIKGGKTRIQMEAIKIERKALGDDVFAPPAGYKEIRMGDMMRKAHDAMGQRQGRNQGQGDPQYGQPEPKQGQGEPKGGQDKSDPSKH